MPTLHLVTGAPGAGKSTLIAHLAAYPFVAVDFDELIEPVGELLGMDIRTSAASRAWPGYNKLWVEIIALLLRGDGPLLVMCPLSPDEWERAVSAVPAALPEAVWARLDCADTDRRARLAARGWDEGRIEDAVEDAAELRRAVGREFTTSGRPAAETAAGLAGWVGGRAVRRASRRSGWGRGGRSCR
ncbi:AAA family ATPase [Streptomyces sp. UNOB3_S3]|uniref:AAA family ATPase n=1 Tax=Streptomyces sp. UNOB3_S3 TaxID=2871682 RepID=UPI001E3DC8A0|nr:AAA family ATPase [Streptomyces sp. UNOB3_S3]MCC3777470.1 AAA family ATPase [Streptomyces sp. UNOB3_S3]